MDKTFYLAIGMVILALCSIGLVIYGCLVKSGVCL